MMFAREFPPDTTEWAKAPLAVVDFETTGLDHHEDRIVEVGVVLLRDSRSPRRSSWRVNAGVWVPQDVTAVHGISTHEIVSNNYRSSLESLVALYDYFTDHLPVAYNAPFDRRFLHSELHRRGAYRGESLLPPAFRYGLEWIDVRVWLRHFEPKMRDLHLGEVCEAMEIPLERAHRALDDAAATAELLMQLAPRMPKFYGELIREQVRIAAVQKVDKDLAVLRPPAVP